MITNNILRRIFFINNDNIIGNHINRLTEEGSIGTREVFKKQLVKSRDILISF